MRASKRGRVALWTLLVGVGMALVAVVTFLWQHAVRPDGPGAPLRVEARGSGRAWRFSYSGSDGVLGTGDDPVSVGHLMLPEGAEVVVELRSDDYIYVFSCPGLMLKEIAVPDLDYSLSIRAGRRGEYDLLMDPMCGFRLPPGETMGTLSVTSEGVFRRWIRERTHLETVRNKSSQ